MERSLGFVEKVKDSGNESVQIAERDQSCVKSLLIKSHFGNGFQGGISGQLVLQSFIVHIDNSSNLLGSQTVVTDSNEG